MDYDQFFKEIAEWVSLCNVKAVELNFMSPEFWNWVMMSIAEICEKYDNHKLVQMQSIMLVDWLTEMYTENLKRGA